MLVFIVLNLIVGLNIYFIIRRYFRDIDISDYWIIFFLFFLTQIILTETILGFWGKLFLTNLAALNLGILAISSIFVRGIRNAAPVNRNSYISQTISREFFSNKTIILSISVILGFAVIKALINLINPPFGWDDLNYHFTFPVEWLKHGNLDNPIVINDNPAPSYYPMNGSLFYFWLIAPFRSVFLADLGQLPFFIMAFITIYNISRFIGVRKGLSTFAAVLLVITPNFFKQIEIAYVDIMVATLFFIALKFMLQLSKEYNLKNIFLFSVSCGLLIGTKTTALSYSIALIIPFFYIVFRNVRRFGFSHFIYYTFVFLLCLSAIGGYSYIRNLFLTGNPLYPLKIELLGKTLFKGVLGRDAFNSTFKPYDYSLAKVLFHEGFGVQSILLFFPAILVFLFFVFKKRKSDFISIYLLSLPAILILIYYLIIPFPCTRFLYPFIGISSVVAFYTFNAINVKPKIIISIVIVCLLASISELAGHMELILSLLMSILFYFFIAKLNSKHSSFYFDRKKLLVFALIVVILLKVLEVDHRKHEYGRYVKNSPYWHDATVAWEWVNNNTKGDNIAYVGRPVPFPLYGTDFKNNVYYVSVNDKEPRLHNYPTGHYFWSADFITLHRNLEKDGNYRGNSNYIIWQANLLRKKTDLLFIYSLHQIKGIEFPIEDRWANGHPQRFRLVFQNASIHIYKVSE